MSGTLYVVATPIGNLEDITLRALRILREVAVVAAEDTRRTGRLLSAHNISARMISFHEHNTRARLPQLLARLERGDSIALVSDAGTPGISDPGLELVQGCIGRSIRVDPIPGVSAPLAALMASGLPMIPFTMFGFAPSRSKDRTAWLTAVSKTPHTFSFFDSPNRVLRTLTDAMSYFGIRPIFVARELTKVHQEFIYFVSPNLIPAAIKPLGEFTVIVGPPRPHTGSVESSAVSEVSDNEILDEFALAEKIAASRREATRLVGHKYGISQKLVYAALERARKIGRTTDGGSLG